MHNFKIQAQGKIPSQEKKKQTTVAESKTEINMQLMTLFFKVADVAHVSYVSCMKEHNAWVVYYLKSNMSCVCLTLCLTEAPDSRKGVLCLLCFSSRMIVDQWCKMSQKKSLL